MSEPSFIWLRQPSIDALNRMREQTLVAQLGIEFTEIGHDSIRARMPVDARTRQPFGLLHGGASAALAETVASTAANLVLADGYRALGLELNANHLCAVSDGFVVATATPLHIGRRTQVWQIHVRDDNDRLVSTARMTAIVLESP